MAIFSPMVTSVGAGLEGPSDFYGVSNRRMQATAGDALERAAQMAMLRRQLQARAEENAARLGFQREALAAESGERAMEREARSREAELERASRAEQLAQSLGLQREQLASRERESGLEREARGRESGEERALRQRSLDLQEARNAAQTETERRRLDMEIDANEQRKAELERRRLREENDPQNIVKRMIAERLRAFQPSQPEAAPRPAPATPMDWQYISEAGGPAAGPAEPLQAGPEKMSLQDLILLSQGKPPTNQEELEYQRRLRALGLREAEAKAALAEQQRRGEWSIPEQRRAKAEARALFEKLAPEVGEEEALRQANLQLEDVGLGPQTFARPRGEGIPIVNLPQNVAEAVSKVRTEGDIATLAGQLMGQLTLPQRLEVLRLLRARGFDVERAAGAQAAAARPRQWSSLLSGLGPVLGPALGVADWLRDAESAQRRKKAIASLLGY